MANKIFLEFSKTKIFLIKREDGKGLISIEPFEEKSESIEVGTFIKDLKNFQSNFDIATILDNVDIGNYKIFIQKIKE